MATHINYAVIVPSLHGLPESFGVAIVRGVEASGNTGNVRLDHIAQSLSLDEAIAVASAAKHVPCLNFWAYAKADGGSCPSAKPESPTP